MQLKEKIQELKKIKIKIFSCAGKIFTPLSIILVLPGLLWLIGVMKGIKMNKEIILQVKNVYGKDLIYPSCHIANALIKLKNGKTFSKDDLNVFKSLGLIIKWKAETI